MPMPKESMRENLPKKESMMVVVAVVPVVRYQY